jgi:phosphodiesterase/alkaline phosphatase D-like protein
MKKAAVLLWLIVFLFSLSATGGEVDAAVSFAAPELLARPTDHSVTVNVVANQTIEAYFQYGTEPGVYTNQTGTTAATGGTPLQVVIDGLSANTQYYYQMAYREVGTTDWIFRDAHSFHTQRAPNSTFTFTIISDSHMNGGGGNVALYQQTLNNVLAENPDFHLDLGDTFWMDGVTSATVANQRYLNQRSWMGTISHSIPIFVSPGNHEQEEAWHLDDTGNPATSPPVLSANARKKYFPNPVPDAFYSGNPDPYSYLDGDHLREDFYAWTWGDALFVVIDPYWYTTTKPYIGNAGGGESSDVGSGDRWDWTLGKTQFDWLKTTLQTSNAKYKFIFDHHQLGGAEDYVRGGAGTANLVEWGGYNKDGTTWGFSTRRPGWGDTPIHQLMVANHVTAFFHGHDHLYAYEARDGVVYQEVPSPALTGSGLSSYYNNPYKIKVLPSPGHIRVTVSPSQVTVDYVATSGGAVSYSYTIAANSGTNPPVAPSNLTATAVSTNQINLSWQDNSSDEAGFKVERRNGADVYTELATTSVNIATYNDASLSPSTIYYYRVRAYNANGDSAYSNEISATTLSPPPAAPSNLTATVASTNQINLKWQDNSGDESGFKIERKTGASGTYAQIATTNANIATYSNTGLLSSTTYYYRVRAYNAGGNSAYSNEASSTTLAPPPSSNLASNKSATADSEQTSMGNTASKGNDGNSSTRWSANDGRLNHWWKVDLGASYTLTGIKVQFQFARNYRYKIEVSKDNINWTIVANRTTTTNTAQTRQDSFSATPGRYVRITYTGLPWYPTTWASHYEFEVYGN